MPYVWNLLLLMACLEKATCIIQGYTSLKPEQLEVVSQFMKGKDVFNLLPTGYGKTRFGLLHLVYLTFKEALMHLY